MQSPRMQYFFFFNYEYFSKILSSFHKSSFSLISQDFVSGFSNWLLYCGEKKSILLRPFLLI